MYMGVLSTCMSVYHVCAWCLQRGKEGVRSVGIQSDSCQLPCGCWKSNPGSLEEQPVLWPLSSLSSPVVLGFEMVSLVFLAGLKQAMWRRMTLNSRY